MRKLALAALTLGLALTAPGTAWAHKMLARSRVHEDGTVLLQAFFPDGKPARDITIEVRRPDGSRFKTGKTDERGKFTFTPDGTPGRWTATFTGTLGHKTETSFDIAPAAQGIAPGAGSTSVAGRVPTASAEGRAAPVAADRPAPAPSTSESLIQKEPLPATQVLAGLGFIFGLSAFLLCLKLRADIRRLRGDVDS